MPAVRRKARAAPIGDATVDTLVAVGEDRTAVLTGARRFDRGVERQQVGLPRDFVDHADDVGDLVRGLLDPGHRLHRLRDHRAAAIGAHGRTSE